MTREFIAGSARVGFISHSDEVHTDGERVMLIDGEELADLVINAGLVEWLIQEVW